MHAKYVISEDDYVRAMKLFSKITPKVALFYCLGIAVLLSIAVFGSPVIRGGIIGGLIAGGGVYLICRLVVNPLLARRHYRKYKAIHEPVEMRLRQDGIEFANSDASGVVRWNTIFRWRQNRDYILVYPMPRMYHVIPKSVKDRGTELQPLIDALRRNVGKET